MILLHPDEERRNDYITYLWIMKRKISISLPVGYAGRPFRYAINEFEMIPIIMRRMQRMTPAFGLLYKSIRGT